MTFRDDDLVNAARLARVNAWAPFSSFAVGAASVIATVASSPAATWRTPPMA